MPKTKRVEKKEIQTTLPVVDMSGKKAGIVSLSEEIFAQDTNNQSLSQAVYTYQLRNRQGTVGYKTRGSVRGSTRKLYKQKGTGRARHGASKAPIFVGGGIAHGPKPRNKERFLPKGNRRKALFYALQMKQTEGMITVVDTLEALEAKTKALIKVLNNLGMNNPKAQESILLVVPQKMENVERAGRNIPYVQTISVPLLNAYEVLRYKRLIFVKQALSVLMDQFAKQQKTTDKKANIVRKRAQIEKKGTKT